MFGFRWVQRFRLPFGFRSSLTRNGLGFSWGIPGLRFGVSPSGRKWMSVGFPRLGLYFFRYLGASNDRSRRTDQGVLLDDGEMLEAEVKRNNQQNDSERAAVRPIRFRNQNMKKTRRWKNLK